jgi:hypothetical protein
LNSLIVLELNVSLLVDEASHYYDDGSYSQSKGVEKSYTKGEGIVTEHVTGLMWEDTESVTTEKYNWTAAKKHCANLILFDATDWKLPTRKELATLLDYGKTNSKIDNNFIQTASDVYWTRTEAKWADNKAMAISFKFANQYPASRATSYYVRCVVYPIYK